MLTNSDYQMEIISNVFVHTVAPAGFGAAEALVRSHTEPAGCPRWYSNGLRFSRLAPAQSIKRDRMAVESSRESCTVRAK